MAMIGRNAAVAEVGPHRHEVHGTVAFAAWLGVHADADDRRPPPDRRVRRLGLGLLRLHRGPQVLDRSDAPRIDWGRGRERRRRRERDSHSPSRRSTSPGSSSRSTTHLPLPVRAGHDRARPSSSRSCRRRGTASGDAGAPAADPFFGTLLLINVADRRRDRAGAGVPVRHELVGLLPVRRRRVRCAAGDGGSGRVLPGVDVPRAVAVRLGPAAARASTWRRIWLVAIGSGAVGGVHHGRQLVDAAPGRLHDQPDDRPRRSSTTSGRVFTNPVFCGATSTCCSPRSSPARSSCSAVSAWHLRRGAAPRSFRRTAQLALVVLVPAIAARADGRQPARRHRDDVPADEDRGGRGAVEHLPAVLVLALPDRRRQQTTRRRRKIIEIPHLLSILATGTWNGQVVGLNELQAAVRAAVRPGQLHARTSFIQYWSMRVMAYLGALRLPARAVGAWLLPRETARARTWFLWLGGCGDRRSRSS